MVYRRTPFIFCGDHIEFYEFELDLSLYTEQQRAGSYN